MKQNHLYVSVILWFMRNTYLANEMTKIYFLYTRGEPKTLKFIYKNIVFIITCLNCSHLQSALHLVQHIYGDFPLLQTVFELTDFDAF